MSFHYMLQNIPDHRFLTVNNCLCRLNSRNDTTFNELSLIHISVLMEPIMKREVVTPEENMGDVIGDLNKRRGRRRYGV